jgi:hypothetical protein
MVRSSLLSQVGIIFSSSFAGAAGEGMRVAGWQESGGSWLVGSGEGVVDGRECWVFHSDFVVFTA